MLQQQLLLNSFVFLLFSKSNFLDQEQFKGLLEYFSIHLKEVRKWPSMFMFYKIQGKLNYTLMIICVQPSATIIM